MGYNSSISWVIVIGYFNCIQLFNAVYTQQTHHFVTMLPERGILVIMWSNVVYYWYVVNWYVHAEIMEIIHSQQYYTIILFNYTTFKRVLFYVIITLWPRCDTVTFHILYEIWFRTFVNFKSFINIYL